MDRQEDIIEEEPRDRGFTLIELLIVIAILGILSTIVVLSVRGITDRGQDAACDADQRTLEVAYEASQAAGKDYSAITGSIEASLVTDGYLNSQSDNYDIDNGGNLTGTGDCAAATTVATTAAPTTT